MTIRESLLSVSAYPIPIRTVEAIALKWAIDLNDEADSFIVSSSPYRMAQADLYVWLYGAPNVSQGGQSYSFTSDQRELWKKKAAKIYEELGMEDELSSLKGKYGYMGSRL